MNRSGSFQFRAARLVLSLVLLLFCFGITAFAEGDYPQQIRTVPSEDLSGKVVILLSNDVHGAIRGINGQPFRPKDVYAVACTDFMAAGGDTYYVLSGKEAFDTGLPMDEMLDRYIQEELNGILTASQYGGIRGDQTIIAAVDAEDAA